MSGTNVKVEQSGTPNETSIRVVSDLEIELMRTFEAPRELVYQACTEPRHMTQWWGPRGFTLPVCEMDVRPGGAYRFVQRDADGGEHPFHGEFREVQPPARLVLTQIYDPIPQSEVLLTLTLDEVGEGRTRLRQQMRFDSIQSRDGMLQSGMEWGARQSMDRLAELLQALKKTS